MLNDWTPHLLWKRRPFRRCFLAMIEWGLGSVEKLLQPLSIWSNIRIGRNLTIYPVRDEIIGPKLSVLLGKLGKVARWTELWEGRCHGVAR